NTCPVTRCMATNPTPISGHIGDTLAKGGAWRVDLEVQKPPISSHDAAKESNLPSRGLPGPASFEDWMGHQARAAPAFRLRSRPIWPPGGASHGSRNQWAG